MRAKHVYAHHEASCCANTKRRAVRNELAAQIDLKSLAAPCSPLSISTASAKPIVYESIDITSSVHNKMDATRHTSIMINYSTHFFSTTSPRMINETNIMGCSVPNIALFMGVFLTIFVLPIHLLMIKILYKVCEMTLPRHKIMMSLTISDALQIFTITVLMICNKISKETSYYDVACKYNHAIIIFFGTVTLFVSSMSIVSLSIERYITCIYSLHVYHILTTTRISIAIAIQWAMGIVIGVISACLHLTSERPQALLESSTNIPVSVFIILPSATVITVIQLRLFLFSRSKLDRVRPVNAFGNQAEMTDFRKRQLKITFIASIVAIAYIVCMFPMAIFYAYEWQHGIIMDNNFKSVFASLVMVNTLIDPFIYGIGIQETRKLMLKNMKEAKDLLLWHLFKCHHSY